MRYEPGLDGVRALAVLAVMVFHAWTPHVRGGYLGVEVFFVLSGFLITALLIEEHRDTGRIALGRFYLRRAVRLYPALLFMLAVSVLLAPLVFSEFTLQEHLRDAGLAGLYAADYAQAFYALPNVLDHTWSLAVEAHYYLLWPLALFVILRLPRRQAISLLVALTVLATLWRWLNIATVDQWRITYFRSDTRLSGLFLGSLLAYVRPVLRVNTRLVVLGLVACFVIFEWRHGAGLAVGVLVAELLAAALILSVQNGGGRLASAPLVWIGKLSYALYLWHYPIMHYLRTHYGWEIALPAGLASSFVMAAASYYVVESKFLGLRRSLSRERRGESARGLARVGPAAAGKPGGIEGPRL